MNYLYPKFKTATHKTNKSSVLNTDEYPYRDITFQRYNLPIDLLVSIVEESMGNSCQYHRVKVVDERYSDLLDKHLYILKTDLDAIVNKKSFDIICSLENKPNQNSYETDIRIKEPFIPYVDNNNGMYCVKIETEYEKSVSSVFFDKVVKDSYKAGIQILLSSRGFKSDETTINNILNDYYTFAYVLETDNIIDTRSCTPINLVVGIPLRYFNEFQYEREVASNVTEQIVLEFNSKNFKEKTNKILKAYSNISPQYESYLYPNKFFQGFILQYEIESVRQNVNNFLELLEKVKKPLLPNKYSEYTIGLTSNLDILSIKIKEGSSIYSVPKNVLKQYQYKDSFWTKRLLHLYINSEIILQDSVNLQFLDFVNKYVKYPQAVLKTFEVELADGSILNESQVQTYSQAYLKNQEQCYRISGRDIYFSDPIYHLFIENFEESKEIRKSNREKAIKDIQKTLGTETTDTSLNGISQGFQTFIDNNFKNEIGWNLPEQANNSWRTFNVCMTLLNKINVNKVIMDRLLCYLRNADPNDAETIKLLQRLTPEIISYLGFIIQNRNLQTQQFWEAIVRRFPVDVDSFCISNQYAIYWIKAIVSLAKTGSPLVEVNGNIFKGINTLDVDFTLTRRLDEFLKTRPSLESAYATATQAILKNIFTISTQYIFSAITEYLDVSCEENSLDLRIGDENPLNTNIPSLTGVQSINNSDPKKINKNRNTAASNAVPVRYEQDPETTVDLLSLLIDDISCVLTAPEICDLLDDNPSQESILLIKNIIRRKYANDLGELLQDSNLRLLFILLSRTVDPSVCGRIRESLPNDERFINTVIYNPSQLCSPEQLKYRKEVLENKAPTNSEDLLKINKTKNIQKANKLLDLLENGPNVDYSVICPDESSTLTSDYSNAQEQTIRQLLEDIMAKFNSDATIAVDAPIGEEVRQLKNSDGFVSNFIKLSNSYKNILDNTYTKIDRKFLVNDNIFYDDTATVTTPTSLVKQQFISGNLEVPINQHIINYNNPINVDREKLKAILLSPIDPNRSQSKTKCPDLNPTIVKFDLPIYVQFTDAITDNLLEANSSGDSINDSFLGIGTYISSDLSDFIRGESIPDERLKNYLRQDNIFITLVYDDIVGSEDYDKVKIALVIKDSSDTTQFIYKINPIEYDVIEESGGSDNIWRDVKENFLVYLKNRNDNLYGEGFETNSAFGSNIIYRTNFTKLQYLKNIQLGSYIKTFLNSTIERYYNENQSNIEKAIKDYQVLSNIDLFLSNIDELTKMYYVKRNEYVTSNNDKLELWDRNNDRFVKVLECSINNSINNPSDDLNFYSLINNESSNSLLGIQVFYRSYNTNKEKFNYNLDYYGYDVMSDDFRWAELDERLRAASLQSTLISQDFIENNLFVDNTSLKFSYDQNDPDGTIKSQDFQLNDQVDILSAIKSINLNLKQSPKQKACGIMPHYLNLSILLGDYKNSYIQQLCENLPNPAKETSKQFILTTLVRIYIADILNRMTLKMIKHSKEKNENLHNDENFTEIILNLFKLEISNVSENAFIAITQEIEKLYKKQETEGKLKQSLLPSKSSLHYFIKKEIKYFCKHLESFIDNNDYLKVRRHQVDTHLFTLDDSPFDGGRISIKFLKLLDSNIHRVSLFLPRTSVPVGEIRSQTDEIVLLEKEYEISDGIEAVKQFLKEDEYKFLNKLYGFDLNNLMSYIWLYNSTNYDIKSKFNFIDTKNSILKLFVKYFAETVDINNRPEDKALADLLNDQDEFRNLSQSEIEQYIRNAANSSYPEIYLLGDKKIRSQVGEILKNIYGTTSKIVQTYIQNIDPAVFIGKLISKSVNIPLAILWNTLSEQQKYEKLCESNDFTRFGYYQISNGKSILPDSTFNIAGAAIAGKWTKETTTHTAFDIIDYSMNIAEYTDWNSKFNQNSNCNPPDPCIPRNGTGAYEEIKCTPQRKEQLIKELSDKEN